MKLLLILPACAGLLFMMSCAATGGESYNSHFYDSSYSESTAANSQAEAQANSQFATDEANLANQMLNDQMSAAAAATVFQP